MLAPLNMWVLQPVLRRWFFCASLFVINVSRLSLIYCLFCFLRPCNYLLDMPSVVFWMSYRIYGSSRCHRLFCRMWLWHFLVVLTYFLQSSCWGNESWLFYVFSCCRVRIDVLCLFLVCGCGIYYKYSLVLDHELLFDRPCKFVIICV